MLSGIDAKRDGGKHHDAWSFFTGYFCRFPGQEFRLKDIGAIRQVVIVSFRGTPGEESHLITALFHSFPVIT